MAARGGGGKPARAYTPFGYRTRRRGSRLRRVVAKAEQIADQENPRYAVTSWGAEP